MYSFASECSIMRHYLIVFTKQKEGSRTEFLLHQLPYNFFHSYYDVGVKSPSIVP